MDFVWQFQRILAENRHDSWELSDCNEIKNPQSISLLTRIIPFSQTGQMVELCCDNLSVWCIDSSFTRSQVFLE